MPLLLLTLLIILFWHPVFFNNEFYGDDLDFLKAFESGQFSLKYMLAPHNEHFMPIFKLLFFMMFKLFGRNLIPCLMLSLILHIVNSFLLFKLSEMLFPKNRWLPFLVAVLFAVNSAYFEVIHWFTIINSAMSLFFLLLTLVLLHRYALEKKDWLLYSSAVSSFFIPVGFSLGLIGIAFIWLYAWLVLKLPKIRIAVPYLIAWSVFLVLYGLFVARVGVVGAGSLTLDPLKIVQYVFFGYLGAFLKTMGFSVLVAPYTIVLSVLLTIQFVFVGYFLLLYLFLNRREERIAAGGERGILWFCLLSALLCYMAIAVTRSSLGVEAFLSWGRYHYFPILFFSILAGSMARPVFKIFSKVYSPRRLKIFFVILFSLYLMTQLAMIRQKSFSPVRVEGALPKLEIPV